MDPEKRSSHGLSRRAFFRVGASGATSLGLAPALAGTETAAGQSSTSKTNSSNWEGPAPHPFLTPAKNFRDVSRGTPKPFSLTGAAREAARLTPETWRLEITTDAAAQPPQNYIPASLQRTLTLADGTALDLAALKELGKKHEVKFLKAMQCLNIDTPLGQGLWVGVPLRDVLRACGKMNNVRRIYYWGFHNDDPKQIFQSSVSYTQALETPPGELPVFLAYELNGGPIPIERGGPVRMVVPWSHGFKSIKWLQHIFVTNDPRINDTYANANNDPDSYLKTAAYLDGGPKLVPANEPVFVTGQVIAGPSGVKRVEYWVRRVEGQPTPLADDAPELLQGPWVECRLQEPPDWSTVLPEGVKTREVLGFDKTTGAPLSWPLHYSMVSYSATIRGLKPGSYEVRARAVDLNDFAQPEPRPAQKSGKNAIQVRRFEVA